MEKFVLQTFIFTAAVVFLLKLSPADSFSTSRLSHSPEASDPTTRARLTLEGLFQYYWKKDPLKKQIGFLFVCGQIGGWGEPHREYECSCNNPTSCVNCYRWWDAVALESVATYGIYTNHKNFSKVADTIYAHSPYNSKWNATR